MIFSLAEEWQRAGQNIDDDIAADDDDANDDNDVLVQSFGGRLCWDHHNNDGDDDGADGDDGDDDAVLWQPTVLRSSQQWCGEFDTMLWNTGAQTTLGNGW